MGLLRRAVAWRGFRRELEVAVAKGKVKGCVKEYQMRRIICGLR